VNCSYGSINLSFVIYYYLLSIINHLSYTTTMTAPFIPPPIDSSAPTVGTLSSLSLPGVETGPVANTAPVVPGEPRPVVPAEEIGVPPAKALDPVAGGPGLFEKAKEIGMPVGLSLLGLIQMRGGLYFTFNDEDVEEMSYGVVNDLLSYADL
jgi:hypothetical protein